MVGEHVLKANGRELKKKIDWLKAVVALEIGDHLVLDVSGKDGAIRSVRIRLRPR